MEDVIERVKQIILKPRDTWETISKEEITIPDLFKNYLLILAVVPALASFLGRWDSLGFGKSLVNSIIIFLISVTSVWIAGKIISLFAPNFDSLKDDAKGFQVAAYSYTPVLVAGIINLIPPLSHLILFFAGLYGLYVLSIGLPIVMETPRHKSFSYTVVIVVASILIYFIVNSVINFIL